VRSHALAIDDERYQMLTPDHVFDQRFVSSKSPLHAGRAREVA
jgi:hypothetical protein